MKTLHSIQTSVRWKLSAVGLAMSLVAGTALAAPPEAMRAKALQSNLQAKSGSTEAHLIGGHHQKRKLEADERKPSAPPQLNAKIKYGEHDESKATNPIKRPSASVKSNAKALVSANGKAVGAAAAAGCDLQVFASSSGSALVSAVKASTVECLNGLYNISGASAGQTFSESKMVSIAYAFRDSSTYYNGTNSDGTLQLVTFLRAGYYVNYYNSADTGVYGTSLKTAIRSALDSFVNNGNFGLVNDVHGETLSEVMTLIDSASENARYLNSAVKRLLTSYNSSYNTYWWMKGAVNNAFTVLFRGHQNADFKTLVQSDTSIIDTLYNFINSNSSQLGTDTGYLFSNAGREMARFLQYPENSSLKSLTKSRVKLLVDRSNVTGSTAGLWVGLGEMVDYYDKANCSYYGLCDFVQRLETNVLPIKYTCSPTLRVRAQSLTQAQLQEVCSTVGGEEGYFHTQVASGKIPVANDNNSQLEMVIFSSSNDYGTYAGAIFGIDTNNGGMYLEGDPSLTTNQPRFIAYQAEWMLPKFEVWNLTHEYIHYLDGRFNMFGDFNAAMGVSSVWWIEGFAEYISYSYRNLAYDGAKQQAALATYSLSNIFRNDYNSGQTKIYNWGYLAVRYMFEKQRPKVTNLLGYFRPGNWTGYTTYLNGSSMGTSMDSDFRAWLPCVNTPTLPNCGNGGNNAPVANFNFAVSNLTVNFTDLSTDSDGTIASRTWSFGDGSTSTAANPTKTYSAAGTYTVKLDVKDDKNAPGTITKTVVVGSTPNNILPVPKFTNSVSGLTVSFTDQSTDSDGTIVSRLWSFGDGTTSTATNPVKTYSVAGTYAVSLTVTDNKGGFASTQPVSIAVSSGGSNLPECAAPSNALGKNCVRSNISGVAGDYQYFYLYVPTGTKKIVLSTTGGTGNANMYVSLSSWATRDTHHYRSTKSGNGETVTVTNPAGGSYIYVSLYGASAFSGVQLKTQF